MTYATSASPLAAQLAHAGELLRQGQADEAARALEHALEGQPDDPRARSMLGLAYFKSGRQDAANELYRALATDFPEDPQVQLQLGLVQLKRGEVDEALRSLGEACRLDPWNGRARECLALARRQAGASADLDAAAAEALLAEPESVTAFAARRLVAPGEPCRTASGALVLEVRHQIYARSPAVACASAGLAFGRAYHRRRGVDTQEPFGEVGWEMELVAGAGELVLLPRGGRLNALTLEDDILYLREDALVAWTGDLTWESGRAPKSGAPLVQLRGTGTVVVETVADPFCIKVEPDRPARARLADLVGWVGRVVVRALAQRAGASETLECAGEGVLVFSGIAPVRR
jgi:tetratricopeptide (TPR) repeat protein